ncbi:MAG: Ig-like domain-containing protein [Bacilli bacterium]|jgi:hypothetical protein|nr:Ig-like domain-containing protein [Bacilli bacterium]
MNNKIKKIFILALFIISIFSINNKIEAENKTAIVGVTLNGTFTFINDEGKYVKYSTSTGNTSGSLDIKNERYRPSTIPFMAFDVTNSPSFTYKSNNKYTDISILGPGYSSIARGTNAKSVTISNAKGVTKTSINGKNMAYDIGLAAHNNYNIGVNITGKKSNGTVSIEDSKQGIIVKGTSGVSNLVLDYMKNYNDEPKTFKFIPYKQPVTFTNLNGKIKVKNAKLVSNKLYDHNQIGLHAYVQDSNNIRLSWNPMKNAKAYNIYKYNYQTKKYYFVKRVNGQYNTLWVDTKLKNNKLYNYKVQPILKNNKKGKLSYYVSAVTKSKTRNNVTTIIPNHQKISGKVGKTIKMKASVKTSKGYQVYNTSVRWYSNNSKIASITKDGKLVLKKKGKTYIWAKAHNGKNKVIYVTVK